MAPPATPGPTVEAGSWRLLPPPRDDGEKTAIGVVETHPSLHRVAYATRARDDRGPDLGNARVVVHDYDSSSHCNGPCNSKTLTAPPRQSRLNQSLCMKHRVVASFQLRELVKRINEFRAHSSMMASTAHAQHSRELLKGLSSAAAPQSSTPYTVELMGAVQKISFLDREAVRCQVPPGYVREESSRMQRLLIGFRRCAVVVSVFHLKHQSKDDVCGARGVRVVAYLGPDDLNECEQDEKATKRQPSSFPIPVSEQILAYGCYDGGIRFYDVVRRKQVKSALGPNGRGNPVVSVINANKATSAGIHGRTSRCQTTLPRIVSVCATGVAYLWELYVSIDLDNGEVIRFDIPPPLASFHGLVAATSWKGIPVKYPPSLSPTSIATLSPYSSWEQTDEVQSQFAVTFDQRANELYWVFSPDCLGATLTPHATRDERLDMDGALVCWDLTTLPRQEWPPSALPPTCVAQLPRGESGRISCDMIIPGIQGVLPASHLTAVYIASSNALMAAVIGLREHEDYVQRGGNATSVADLTTLLHRGQHGFISGFACYAISASKSDPSCIAVGTDHGVLFATLSEVSNRKQPPELPVAIHRTQPLAYAGKGASTQQQQLDVLESRNRELERQLDQRKTRKAEATVLQSEVNAAAARIKSLENVLMLKEKSRQALKVETEALKDDLDNARQEIAQEKHHHEKTVLELESMKKNADSWETEAAAKEDALAALQKECNNLQKQLGEMDTFNDRGWSERDSRLTTSDYLGGQVQKEVVAAKETEESLRTYISLLEADKAIMDKDLEEARQQAEEYAQKDEELRANLRADVREQKSVIDSLVVLHEKQKQEHRKEMEDRDGEISALATQLSELQMKYTADVENTKRLQAENAVMRADAQTGNEVFMLMKKELHSALNQLSQCQQEHKG